MEERNRHRRTPRRHRSEEDDGSDRVSLRQNRWAHRTKRFENQKRARQAAAAAQQQQHYHTKIPQTLETESLSGGSGVGYVEEDQTDDKSYDRDSFVWYEDDDTDDEDDEFDIPTHIDVDPDLEQPDKPQRARQNPLRQNEKQHGVNNRERKTPSDQAKRARASAMKQLKTMKKSVSTLKMDPMKSDLKKKKNCKKKSKKSDSDSTCCSRCCSRLCSFCLMFLSIAILLGAAVYYVGITFLDKDWPTISFVWGDTSTVSRSAPNATVAAIAEMTDRFIEMKKYIIDAGLSLQSELEFDENNDIERASPQLRALKWIADEDHLRVDLPRDFGELPEEETFTRSDFVQRYTLAVIFYSAKMSTTKFATVGKWLSPTSECDWMGVKCLAWNSHDIVQEEDDEEEEEREEDGRRVQDNKRKRKRKRNRRRKLSTNPSTFPSTNPSTIYPTKSPSISPTTAVPTSSPTFRNTVAPSNIPSSIPTPSPTNIPTPSPTVTKTTSPSKTPTLHPTVAKTTAPTRNPTAAPSVNNKTTNDSLATNKTNSKPIPPPHVEELLQHHIISLNLTRGGLSGTIPAEIFSLHSLKALDLSRNGIAGDIPKFMFQNFTNLEILQLENNKLVGTIPRGIGNVIKLWHLNLSRNQITGTLPSILSKLKALEYLNVRSNKLEGYINPSLGDLIKLERAYFYHNDMVDRMPKSVCNLFGNGSLSVLSADCGGNNPKLECDCCTHCFY